MRGQLLVTPTDRLSIRLIGDYARQKQHYVLNIPVAYFDTYDSGALIPNNLAARVGRAGYSLLPADPFARRGDSDGHYQAYMKSYGGSAQVDWDLGAVALTSVTAYRWWDWDPANDGDSTGLPVVVKAQQANRQRQFSQELRAGSTGTNVIDWTAGLYYFWQTVRGHGASAYGAAAPNWFLPTANPAAANAALNGFEANSYSEPVTKSYAAFGQANWHISERLILTAGLRFTHEDKRGVYRQEWVAGTDLATLAPADAAAVTAIRNQFNPRTSYTVALKDDSLSGLATLSWKVAPDILLYGSYSRGSKSGGLNLTNIPTGAVAQVKPETVDNVEAGIKSQFLGRTLTINLAGYWTQVANYQTAITEQTSLGSLVQYISNIPKVRSRGFEGDVSYAPSKWVGLTASASYTDATYLSYTNAPQAPERSAALNPTQDLSGRQLPGISKFTYTLGADVARPVRGGTVEIYGHADYSHRSTFNTSSSNSRHAQVPAYGLLNVRAGIRNADGRWDLSIWARNLADKDYFQALSAGTFGLVTGTIGDPRTVGATFKTRW
ncbi:MAG: TonB-dependent receptor [Pseudomonadota bacterium]|nr:TonB-dependent receptor [Pseudomonadota bacterium]